MGYAFNIHFLNNFFKNKSFLNNFLSIGLVLFISTGIMNLLFSSRATFMDAPSHWGLTFQDPATPVMEGIDNFHSDLMFFLVAIGVFVTVIICSIIYKFDIKNKTSRYSEDWVEHPLLETVWTLVPTLILLVIVFPSLSLLFATEDLVKKPYSTFHIVGRQWYWSYEYRDTEVVLRKRFEVLLNDLWDDFKNNSYVNKDNIDGSIVEVSASADIKEEDSESTSVSSSVEVTTKEYDYLGPFMEPVFLDFKDWPEYAVIKSKLATVETGDVNETLGTFDSFSEEIRKTYKFSKKLTHMKYDSYMIPLNDLKMGELRNLSVDKPLIVPAFVPLKLLISSSDVIHSWALPSAGIKVDACPGRLNQCFITFKRPGVFFGQCSEICGVNHALMPIQVIALEPEQYLLEMISLYHYRTIYDRLTTKFLRNISSDDTSKYFIQVK